MSGLLTTHVLDTAIGRPAAGIKIELWTIDLDSGQKTLLKTLETNSDGRCNNPLLVGEEFKIGVYELIFRVGDYFATYQDNLSAPPFLDLIPLRFAISNQDSHYHVPLLVSPWSYSTYRGS